MSKKDELDRIPRSPACPPARPPARIHYIHPAPLPRSIFWQLQIERQARRYDADGAYMRHWLPELGVLPTAALQV